MIQTFFRKIQCCKQYYLWKSKIIIMQYFIRNVKANKIFINLLQTKKSILIQTFCK